MQDFPSLLLLIGTGKTGQPSSSASFDSPTIA
jgi:hypothetical protein